MAKEAVKDPYGFPGNVAMSSTEYDRGFSDAVNFFVNCLRTAATVVEPDLRGTVTKQDSGHTFEAIIKTGDRAYARRLRALADQIEESFIK